MIPYLSLHKRWAVIRNGYNPLYMINFLFFSQQAKKVGKLCVQKFEESYWPFCDLAGPALKNPFIIRRSQNKGNDFFVNKHCAKMEGRLELSIDYQLGV